MLSRPMNEGEYIKSVRLDEAPIFLETTDVIRITRYSRFLESEIIKQDIHKKSVCDFGCGTGILGICAASKGASSVCFVDKNEAAEKLSMRNAMNSGYEHKTDFYTGIKTDRKFDLIISNPSTLPIEEKLDEYSDFYSGGQDGLEMLRDMFDYSKNYLSKEGRVIFLLTTLTDYKRVLMEIGENYKNVKVSSVMQLDFRPHYRQHLEYWMKRRREGSSLFFDTGSGLAELVLLVDAIKK